MNWERNTLRCWFTPMRANRKISTYYEAKSDEEIVVLLGNKMNPEFFQSKGISTDMDMLEYIVQQAPNHTWSFQDLYDGKAAFGAEAAEGLAALERELNEIGRHISWSRGDYQE